MIPGCLIIFRNYYTHIIAIHIKSRANILTRVQSKAYTEPSSSVPCLTCRIARTFTTLARRGT